MLNNVRKSDVLTGRSTEPDTRRTKEMLTRSVGIFGTRHPRAHVS